MKTYLKSLTMGVNHFESLDSSHLNSTHIKESLFHLEALQIERGSLQS